MDDQQSESRRSSDHETGIVSAGAVVAEDGREVLASTERPIMLYGLYFITCLVENPAHFVTRLHTFSEEVSGPQRCLAVAQPQMAQWTNAHPT